MEYKKRLKRIKKFNQFWVEIFNFLSVFWHSLCVTRRFRIIDDLYRRCFQIVHNIILIITCRLILEPCDVYYNNFFGVKLHVEHNTTCYDISLLPLFTSHYTHVRWRRVVKPVVVITDVLELETNTSWITGLLSQDGVFSIVLRNIN